MKAKKPVFILDSFALLAYLGGEPAQKQVEGLLSQAEAGDCRLLLPLINLGEVAYIVERERGLENVQRALAAIQQLPIELIPADQGSVLVTAHVKANYKFSYADAFIVAAALGNNTAIVTGDPEIEALGELITIEILG